MVIVDAVDIAQFWRQRSKAWLESAQRLRTDWISHKHIPFINNQIVLKKTLFSMLCASAVGCRRSIQLVSRCCCQHKLTLTLTSRLSRLAAWRVSLPSISRRLPLLLEVFLCFLYTARWRKSGFWRSSTSQDCTLMLSRKPISIKIILI